MSPARAFSAILLDAVLRSSIGFVEGRGIRLRKRLKATNTPQEARSDLRMNRTNRGIAVVALNKASERHRPAITGRLKPCAAKARKAATAVHSDSCPTSIVSAAAVVIGMNAARAPRTSGRRDGHDGSCMPRAIQARGASDREKATFRPIQIARLVW